MNKRSILIFGTGPLQKSIIERCKIKGLFTVGIDPMENAVCKKDVDAFEVIDGQNFTKTVEIAKKYKVAGIITAATDKPLVMMARVAKKIMVPFFSVETAECSTDKLLMKQKFQENSIPCANGYILNNINDFENLSVNIPVIVKPRDNSGSRGVIYCNNLNEVESAIKEALLYTHKGNVLVEEFIEGKEFSIECIHYNGESYLIQITEKITTAFPYNVELGHIQPANVTSQQKKDIYTLIDKVSNSLGFDNCASHTEIKINTRGIFVIESSPRLGGDFISSTLVPLSTGINMEDILIDISINNSVQYNWFKPKINKSSGVKYVELPQGIITAINELDELNDIHGLTQWHLSLKPGDKVNKITSSLNRYGYAIFNTDVSDELFKSFGIFEKICHEKIVIS